jgi:hypothetical protein
LSAVFHVEPEPRRAPPAENFAAFLRRKRLIVRVRLIDSMNPSYLATMTDWRVSSGYYDYGKAVEAEGQTPLQAVQRLAERIAGRMLRRHDYENIKVPPLIVPSHMSAADWVNRDASS